MTTLQGCVTGRFTRWVVANSFLDSRFVVLDVGCMAGYCPRWDLLGDAWDLYGIDPIEEEIDKLKARYPQASHTYLTLALGDRDGTVEFDVHEVHEMSSIAPQGTTLEERGAALNESLASTHDQSWTGFTSRRPVRMARLDQLLADGEIPSPDYMKVDVEGFEPEVLAGAEQVMRSGQILAAEFETGFSGTTVAPKCHYSIISEILHKYGFVMFDIGQYRATKRPFNSCYIGAEPGAAQVTVSHYYPQLHRPLGRPLGGDALFGLDLERGLDWVDGTAHGQSVNDRIAKMCLLLELFNLNDCAISLLKIVEARPDLAEQLRFDIEEAITFLIPVWSGHRITLGDYTELARQHAQGEPLPITLDGDWIKLGAF